MNYYRHLTSYKCDQSFLDLERSFQKLYGVQDLSSLHRYFPSFSDYQPPNDSSSIAHKIFYSNFNDFFSTSYKSILLHLKTILSEPFYYQKIPCVRFAFPGTTWLSSFHKDSDYNHPIQELNINLAITKSFGSCALQIETTPGSGVYIPLDQDPGYFTFINHIECTHGSIPNNENHTMISLDFRLIPSSRSEAFSESKSILTSSKFQPGSYFSDDPL